MAAGAEDTVRQVSNSGQAPRPGQVTKKMLTYACVMRCTASVAPLWRSLWLRHQHPHSPIGTLALASFRVKCFPVSAFRRVPPSSAIELHATACLSTSITRRPVSPATRSAHPHCAASSTTHARSSQLQFGLCDCAWRCLCPRGLIDEAPFSPKPRPCIPSMPRHPRIANAPCPKPISNPLPRRHLSNGRSSSMSRRVTLDAKSPDRHRKCDFWRFGLQPTAAKGRRRCRTAHRNCPKWREWKWACRRSQTTPSCRSPEAASSNQAGSTQGDEMGHWKYWQR